MFMQNIRRATKKHRTLLTVIVILLMVGVVGSFAVWDSRSFQNQTDQDTISYAEQAEAYKTYIESIEPENVSDAEYADAVNLAQLYSALYQSYIYASYTESDSDLSEQYSASAEEAIAQCIAYYQHALTVVPEELSVDGQAATYAELASVQMVNGDIDGAVASLDSAKELSPYNATVACVNAQYIYYYDAEGSFEKAEAYLNDVLANLEEGSDDYVTVGNQLSSLTATEEYYQNLLEQLANAQNNTSEDSSDSNDTSDASSEDNE